MEYSISDIKKSLLTLGEEDFVNIVSEILEQRNSNLGNSKFLQLKAPPRWNLSRTIYAGVCRCGHSARRHWELNNDFKDCKSCDCEGFYE